MLITATYYIDGDITDLDVERLAGDGVKGLILDLDSTLMAPKAGSITDATSHWLDQARSRFKMIILSNNKRPDYLEGVENLLGIEIIGHAAKPFRQGFTRALERLEMPADAVAVVGDRALTDILGGNLSNMRTVLVMPHKSIVESSWKTCLRNLERSLIRR